MNDLVRPQDLRTYCESSRSGTDFPELIYRLAHESISDDGAIIQIPFGDAGNVTGEDGHIRCNSLSSYVPDGESIWEIKTQKGVQSTAQTDYDKRKKEFEDAGIDGSETTFVFVSGRPWAKAKTDGLTRLQWMKLRKKDNFFKDVKAYDCTSIIDWLGECPATARWARAHLFNQSNKDSGFETVQEFLVDFLGRYSFPASPALLLSGRNQSVEEFFEFLGGTQSKLILCGETQKESQAFIASCILDNANEDRKDAIENKTLFVKTKEAASELSKLRDHIFILPQQVAEESGHVLSTNNKVVIAGDISTVDENKQILPLRDSVQFADGLAKSGLPHDEAARVSNKCGQSVTVLMRQLPCSTGAKPAWHKEEILQSNFVRCMALMGSTNIQFAKDKNAIEKSFLVADYEQKSKQLSKYEEPLIRRVEPVVALVSCLDTLNYCSDYLTSSDFEKFRTEFNNAFATASKPYRTQKFERDDKRKGYSDGCKLGMAQTLLLLAEKGDALQITIHGNPSLNFVKNVIGEQYKSGNFAYFVEQNAAALSYLSEADPLGFLKALETFLEGSKVEVDALFEKHTDLLGMEWRPALQPVLWSMQCLAWKPEFFDKVISLLFRLESVDPEPEETKVSHASRTLEGCFCCWSPQTLADAKQRRRILSALSETYPKIASEITISMLPDELQALGSHIRPIFLRGEPAELTYAEIWDEQDFAARLLLNQSQTEPTLILNGLEGLCKGADHTFTEFLDWLESTFSSANPEDTAKIWTHLEEIASRHERFKNADWSMGEKRIKGLRRCLDINAPSNPVEKYRNLFGWDHAVEGNDEKDNKNQLKLRRSAAIDEIKRFGGLRAIAELISSVDNWYSVLVSSIDCLVFDEFLQLASSNIQGVPANWGTAAAELGIREYPDKFLDGIDLLHQNKSITSDHYEILLGGVLRSDLGRDRVSRLPPETRTGVWRRSRLPLDVFTGDDLLQIIPQLLEARCAHRLVSIPSKRFQKIDSEKLYQIAKQSLEELLIEDSEAKGWFSVQDYLGLLSELKNRDEIKASQIIGLEAPFIKRASLNKQYRWQVHALLAEDADFFIQLLKNAYFPDGISEDEREKLKSDDDRNTNENKNLRETAFWILYTARSDGFLIEGSFDFKTFKDWYGDILTKAKDIDRLDGAMNVIGKIISDTPPYGKTSEWPTEEVAKAIDLISNRKAESAIMIGRHNDRGVFGGSGEEHYKSWAEVEKQAKERCIDYPRTAELLQAMVDDDLRSAEHSKQRHEAENAVNRL